MCVDMDEDGQLPKPGKLNSKKTEIIRGPQFGSGHTPKVGESTVGSSSNNYTHNYLAPQNIKHMSTHTPIVSTFSKNYSAAQRGQIITANNAFKSDD